MLKPQERVSRLAYDAAKLRLSHYYEPLSADQTFSLAEIVCALPTPVVEVNHFHLVLYMFTCLFIHPRAFNSAVYPPRRKWSLHDEQAAVDGNHLLKHQRLD
ncbi:hypothetical protein PsAD2_01265 [Pseudovibrio axinellae]|uniref:Uncharacterized protein n=1 Tax=Pseudovibrio axinellae TaxID=989403 RepID=A0A161V9Y5_9HYPH|nr:hypothetical protein [Pseudovibrio axinellae]KZL20776.1 hypothetical protein PsAD2_01265 [Pseudovibrio axinellae]SER22945.1 hypothetical protein SAMN05421798_107111 [Pseudovibrio axinellae]